MKSVARRIVDGAMLHLIKMWLEAPAEETDERGNKRRSTRNRDEGRGTLVEFSSKEVAEAYRNGEVKKVAVRLVAH